MHKLTRAASLAVAAAAIALTGCKTTDSACADGGACCAEGEAATLSAANESCPLSGRPVSGSVETVSFDGKEVGFCCQGCAGKFAAMSDADKAAALTH